MKLIFEVWSCFLLDKPRSEHSNEKGQGENISCWFSLPAHCGKAWTQLLVSRNTWGNGMLLPALDCLRHCSYVMSLDLQQQPSFVSVILKDPGLRFPWGVSPCLAALLCKPCQESSQPSSPQEALRGWQGPGTACDSSSHFSFRDNISIASWGNLPVCWLLPSVHGWHFWFPARQWDECCISATHLAEISPAGTVCFISSLLFVTLQNKLGQIPFTSWGMAAV